MLGDNIKREMKNKKILAKDLANEIGITSTYLSYILNNKRRNPSMDLLNKIAKILNVSVDTFFDEQQKSSKESTSEHKDIKKDFPIIPERFTNAEDAREYVMKHQIFAYGGIDLHKINDEDILNLANEMLNQAELLGLKYSLKNK